MVIKILWLSLVSCHLTMGVCWMVTKFFWLLKKGGMSHVFGKPLMMAFVKNATS